MRAETNLRILAREVSAAGALRGRSRHRQARRAVMKRR